MRLRFSPNLEGVSYEDSKKDRPRAKNVKPVWRSRGEHSFNHGETDMGDKGKKDKGKRESQKKAQLSSKEKRKLKKEKKKK